MSSVQRTMGDSRPNLLELSGSQQALAVLVLVEDSEIMAAMWPDLYDHYLGKLLDKIEAITPERLILKFVLESSRFRSYPNGAKPRQFQSFRDGLQGLEFSSDSYNGISCSTISSCVEVSSLNLSLVYSLKYVQFLTASFGKPVSKHLIIVAVSPPATTSSDVAAWTYLPQRLSAGPIHSHLLLNCCDGMTPWTTLFYETLRLHNTTEEPLWFPIDPTRVTIRLSAPLFSSSSSGYNKFERGGSYPVVTHLNATPSSREGPMDTQNAGRQNPPSPPPTTAADDSPSLVTQLQIIHGLTKKKIYGSKPTRQPFIGEERVTETPRRPSLMPPPPGPLVSNNPGGRIAPQSVIDRAKRATVRRKSPTSIARKNGPILQMPMNGYPPASLPSHSPLSPGSSSPVKEGSNPIHPAGLSSAAPANPYPSLPVTEMASASSMTQVAVQSYPFPLRQNANRHDPSSPPSGLSLPGPDPGFLPVVGPLNSQKAAFSSPYKESQFLPTTNVMPTQTSDNTQHTSSAHPYAYPYPSDSSTSGHSSSNDHQGQSYSVPSSSSLTGWAG